MLQASVIVPTYNRAVILERCLRALLSQDSVTPPYEIIVVDDASTDDTSERVTGLSEANRLRYLRHEENRGLSATRNTGIRCARGQFVLFVDDDIVVAPDYILEHLRLHASAEGQVAAVGNLTYAHEIVQSSNCARYLQSRSISQRWALTREALNFEDLHPRFLGGGIHSIRRETLIACGMFDESIRFYGYEDHIYAQRLRRSGVRIVLATEARATHYDAVTVSGFRAKMLQAGRDGLPLLRQLSPDFIQGTQLPMLLPVDLARDRGTHLMRKLVVRGALNRGVMWLLERWASATDHIAPLYSEFVYRALNAGWILQGQRLSPDGRSLVRYG